MEVNQNELATYAQDLFDAGLINNIDLYVLSLRHEVDAGTFLARHAIFKRLINETEPDEWNDCLERDYVILSHLFPDCKRDTVRVLLALLRDNADRLRLLACVLTLHDRNFLGDLTANGGFPDHSGHENTTEEDENAIGDQSREHRPADEFWNEPVTLTESSNGEEQVDRLTEDVRGVTADLDFTEFDGIADDIRRCPILIPTANKSPPLGTNGEADNNCVVNCCVKSISKTSQEIPKKEEQLMESTVTKMDTKMQEDNKKEVKNSRKRTRRESTITTSHQENECVAGSSKDIPDDTKRQTQSNMANQNGGRRCSVCHKNDIFNNAITENSDSTENLVQAKKSKQCLSKRSSREKLVAHLVGMFPSVSPDYIWDLSSGKTEQDLDTLVEHLLNEADQSKATTSEQIKPNEKEQPEPPSNVIDVDSRITMLTELFPNADPDFIEFHAHLLNDEDALNEFITNTLEKPNYPTKQDALQREQLSAQVRQYTTEFDVDNFLEVIPNPEEYFSDLTRKTILSVWNDNQRAILVLKNFYSHLHVHTIYNAFSRNLMFTAKQLDAVPKGMYLKFRRRFKEINFTGFKSIPLLQEIAYLIHGPDIRHRFMEKKRQELCERKRAKEQGMLMTCQCCFDEEVMAKDCTTCDYGCVFCKSCVRKSVEVAFGEGKIQFPCLSACSSQFTLSTLIYCLPPKLFSKVAQKKQVEEVKAAGIKDLAACPFCDFATIPPPGDKMLKCMNPECMKESCLQCKELSHVPMGCEEYAASIKRRTYIEDRMTEALLRVCWKCGLKFIKEEGCNKMTCQCGAQMCYICNRPVTDYKHFNGPGGSNTHLCPLYNDTSAMHQQEIRNGAATALQELNLFQNDIPTVKSIVQNCKKCNKIRVRNEPLPRDHIRQNCNCRKCEKY